MTQQSKSIADRIAEARQAELDGDAEGAIALYEENIKTGVPDHADKVILLHSLFHYFFPLHPFAQWPGQVHIFPFSVYEPRLFHDGIAELLHLFFVAGFGYLALLTALMVFSKYFNAPVYYA